MFVLEGNGCGGAGIFYPLATPFLYIYSLVVYISCAYVRGKVLEEIMISTNSIQNRHGFYMPRLREKIEAA